MKNKFFILILLVIFSLVVMASYSYAAKVRVIEGLIENVTGDSIIVGGEYYNIINVPLKNASGEILPRNELKIGKKVGIFFQNGRITAVIIQEYEHMVE